MALRWGNVVVEPKGPQFPSARDPVEISLGTTSIIESSMKSTMSLPFNSRRHDSGIRIDLRREDTERKNEEGHTVDCSIHVI